MGAGCPTRQQKRQRDVLKKQRGGDQAAGGRRRVRPGQDAASSTHRDRSPTKGEKPEPRSSKGRGWRRVGRGTPAGTAAPSASPGRILLSRTGCAQVWGVAAAPWFPLRYPSRTEHRPLARGKGRGVRGGSPPTPSTPPNLTPGVPYPWMMASPPGGSGCWYLLWAPRQPSRGW